MTVPTRAELDALVSARLADDPGFRQTLMDDPRAAVGGALGIELPDFVHVTVHEESLTDVHLVIPSPGAADDAVADEDLEVVSGGVCWGNTSGCAT